MSILPYLPPPPRIFRLFNFTPLFYLSYTTHSVFLNEHLFCPRALPRELHKYRLQNVVLYRGDLH